MKSKWMNDKLRRIAAAEAEPLRTALRFITHSPELPLKTRMIAQFKLNALPRCTAAYYGRRKCVETGRTRWVINEFNISRLKFREMGLKGQLPGVKQASW